MAINFVLGDHNSSTGDVTLQSAGWETGGGAVLITVKSNVPLAADAMASQGFVRIIGVEATGYNLATSVFFKTGIPAGGETYTIPDAGDHTTASIIEFQSSIAAQIAVGASLGPSTAISLGANESFYWTNSFSTTQANAQVVLGLTHNIDATSATLFNTPVQGGLSGAPTIAINQSYNTGTGGGMFIMFGSKSAPGALGTSTGIGTTGTPGSWNAIGFYIELYEVPPPTITSAAVIETQHGTKLAHTITVNQTATLEITTGYPDYAPFELSGNILRWAGDADANFFAPIDSDANNSYSLEVLAINPSTGMSTTQMITVNVVAIQYVGALLYSRAGATSSVNVPLNYFTGGVASSPSAGDLVVVGVSIGSTADRDVIITSGWTEIADIYANGTTYDANLGVFYKFMPSTPDANISLGSSGSTADGQMLWASCWRGVDPTTPIDVAVVTATGTGTSRANPGAITPITAGAVILAIGGGAAATGVNYASSDLTDFRTAFAADTNDAVIGAGYRRWTSGSFDPAVFTAGATQAANSWCAVTLALRAYNPGGEVVRKYVRFTQFIF